MRRNQFIRTAAGAVLGVLLAGALLHRRMTHDIPAPPRLASDDETQPLVASPPGSASRVPPAHRAPAVRPTGTAPSSEPLLRLPESPDAIPDEYALTFFNARDREAFEALAARHGVRILDRLTALHALRVSAPDAAALRALLAAAPRPLSFAPNLLVRIPPLAEEPAAEAPLTPYTGFGAGALRWLGVPEPEPAWGRGVRVAVLDTGIPREFQGHVAMRIDLTGEGSGGSVHGGAVASLISGLQGMAPGATLFDIKTLLDDGTGSAFTLAKGIIEGVDRGAAIINICAGTRGDSPVLAAAVAYARARNVLIVASAGNDGLSGVSYPARYEGVIAVGGVDADGRHLYFSNTGAEVDLSAPGIGLAVPDAATGRMIVFSGTSAATPFVTAAAALLRTLNPRLAPDEIAALLRLYSNDSGAPGPDEAIGAGILDAGRLLNRDTPGIVDAAAIRPFIRHDTDRGLVLADVSGQNRGTVPLPLVEMTVVINGDTQTMRFVNVGVGATFAHTFERPAATVDADGLDIAVAIRPVGLTDANPGNNTGRTVLLPTR